MSNLFSYQSSVPKITIMLLMFLPLMACQTGAEVSFPGAPSNNNLVSSDTNEGFNSGSNDGSDEPVASETDPIIDPVTPVTDPVIDPVAPVTDPVTVPGNPPRNIKASVDTLTNKVTVNWGTVTGATYYELWRSTVAARKGTQVGSPTETSFDDTTATTNTDYWYGLKACNEAGCSGFSGQASVTNSINVIPIASDDSVITEIDVSVNINVLSNDTGLNDGSIQTSIFSASANGTAVVEADNTITYTPNSGYKGSDSFSYKVLDKDNDMATATVLITINCSSCPAPTSLSLNWNPNADQVDGYYVYFGGTASTTNDIVFDTANTMAVFDPITDLSLQTGDKACFRLKAYTSVGESGFTDAVCTTI